MASTLSHLLLQSADAHPERPAVWSSTGELTYADLYDRSMRLARALVEHGIEPGDRVVIALAKDVALPVAIFGTLLAGGAYVPIDYLTPPARARVIVADAEPVALVSSLRTMRAMLGDTYSVRGPDENRPALHWLGRRGPSLSCRPIRSGMCSVPRGRECDISNRQGVRGGGWKSIENGRRVRAG